MPASQAPPPQSCPHDPQLAVSLKVFVSQPSAASPLQSPSGNAHASPPVPPAPPPPLPAPAPPAPPDALPPPVPPPDPSPFVQTQSSNRSPLSAQTCAPIDPSVHAHATC